MLLRDKTAIVYGAGGSIGGAVARAFAREGATVYLAGRTLSTVEQVAEDIRQAGGKAHAASVDALDEVAVDAHAAAVAKDAGAIDVVLNVVSMNDVQGTPLTQLSLDDFELPIRTTTRTQFLTSRAAARHMVTQGSGVILFFGGDGDPMANLGSLQVSFAAVESLRRALACELGPKGVRVLSLQTGGIPESIPADMEGADEIIASLVGPTMLGRAATLEDVGNVAAFAASDLARCMTGTKLNITCGTAVD